MKVLLSHIQNAIESLNANRMRTFLTMLGIMIGIMSMTIILSLSGGLGNMISDQVSNEGGSIIVVRPKEIGANDKNIISNLATSKSFTRSSLTEQDFGSLADLDHVVAASPLASFASEITAAGKKNITNILAVSSELDKAISLKLRDGQFITDTTGSHNTVLGYQLASELFGADQAIGQNIHIKNQPFLVVGVLEPQENVINFNNTDFDNTAIINYTAGKIASQNSIQIQQINVRVDSVNSLDSVRQKIERKMSDNHKGEQDFTVISGQDISHPSDDFIDLTTLVLALVAGVSLVVGGIGIMNIMLVNVSERTREIGIRKALGANNTQIMSQFLTESTIMSLGGGLLGYATGYSFSFGLSTFLPFKPLFSWEIAAVVMLISLVVGVFFGIYPAIRAARKNPIESLRYYN